MARPDSDVFPVIMAGGSGTRFWPLSRAQRPKQFLALATARPLIAETLARLKDLAPVKNTAVVCGARHAALVKKALPNLPARNVIVEPEAKNTAPAIALATAHLARVNPQAVLVVLPSDQHVADVERFQRGLLEAIRAAREGYLVTLGIEPTRPETGYGYLRVGDPLSGEARRVQAFVEKPDRRTAESYLVQGTYLWNAGIFVFRADVMLRAFATYMPELSRGLELIRAALGTKKAAAVLKREFHKLAATSIDYGVAERSDNMAVVPCSCGWSDVGSFGALPEVRPADAEGNVVLGKNAVLLESSGNVVVTGDRLVAVVGMSDVVVVDAGDAVLVLPRERSQDVRQVVDALKARKLTAFL